MHTNLSLRMFTNDCVRDLDPNSMCVDEVSRVLPVFRVKILVRVMGDFLRQSPAKLDL